MMHEEFRRQVFRKLDKISKEMKMQEKLSESLKSLAEPENNENSHRASVEKFSKVEKVPDNAEAILDEHCRALGWNDTPPLQSPSFGVFGRRKSPGTDTVFIFLEIVFFKSIFENYRISLIKSPLRRPP